MTICPHCKYVNPKGALICESCHVLLFTRDEGEPTNLLEETGERTYALPARRGTKTLPSARFILDMGDDRRQVVVVHDGEEIVVGRVDRTGSYTVDVELDEKLAWERGVSRLHCTIRRSGDNIFLTDLESTNGTFLNGERIPPSQPQLLRDGDAIHLGRYEIRIYFVFVERNP